VGSGWWVMVAVGGGGGGGVVAVVVVTVSLSSFLVCLAMLCACVCCGWSIAECPAWRCKCSGEWKVARRTISHSLGSSVC
jgi:hypothetical protein